MPLSAVRVHEDWRNRARIAREKEQRALRRTLLLVLATVFLVRGVAFLETDHLARVHVTEAVAGTVYLIAGVMFLQGVETPRRRLTLWGITLLVGGTVIHLFFVLRRTDTGVASLALGGTLPVVFLGWSFLLINVWRARRWPITRDRLASAIGWGLIGGMAGGLAVLVWALSASFSALFFSPSAFTLLFWQRFLVNVGLLSVGEEFLFRGVLFHLLYRRFDVNFWPATVVALFVNGAFYAVQMVFLFNAPDRAVLFLLGPLLIIIINCALYAWAGNLLSPLVSHVVFRAVSLILGLAG